VAFQFHRCGELVFDTAGDAALEEKILEAALEAGADDVVNEAGESSVLCTPDSFETVQQALATAGLKPSRGEVVMRPANRVAIPAEAQETLLDLLDWLEELDDVHEIYHNAALPAEA
jgi:transcriptional/translational regulatory protein YebC/TACO1